MIEMKLIGKNLDANGANDPDATLGDAAAPIHEQFEWHTPDALNAPQFGYRVLPFAGRVRDLAKGVCKILAILEQDDISSDCGDKYGNPIRKILSKQDIMDMRRMCISSMHMLMEQADQLIEDAEMAAAHRTDAQ